MAQAPITTPRASMRFDIPVDLRDAIDRYSNTIGIGRTAAAILILRAGLKTIRAEMDAQQ